jgi:hypothetical protein
MENNNNHGYQKIVHIHHIFERILNEFVLLQKIKQNIQIFFECSEQSVRCYTSLIKIKYDHRTNKEKNFIMKNGERKKRKEHVLYYTREKINDTVS